MIIIGGPIYRREWVLPYWFDAIEKQDWPLEDLGFVFIAGADDNATLDTLSEWHANHPQVSWFDLVIDKETDHQEKRNWEPNRLQTMVRLRNIALGRIRIKQPERFFSLDSDILLEDPNTISRLYELTSKENIVAASPLMYMTPTDKRFPSVMKWRGEVGGIAYRDESFPIGTTFKADVIMAAKMMTAEAYNAVDYVFHRFGEDVGWSAEITRAGYEIYAMTDIYCPHIMSKESLAHYLESGDSRKIQ